MQYSLLITSPLTEHTIAQKNEYSYSIIAYQGQNKAIISWRKRREAPLKRKNCSLSQLVQQWEGPGDEARRTLLCQLPS